MGSRRINNHFTLRLRAMNDNSTEIVVYDIFFFHLVPVSL